MIRFCGLTKGCQIGLLTLTLMVSSNAQHPIDLEDLLSQYDAGMELGEFSAGLDPLRHAVRSLGYAHTDSISLHKIGLRIDEVMHLEAIADSAKATLSMEFSALLSTYYEKHDLALEYLAKAQKRLERSDPNSKTLAALMNQQVLIYGGLKRWTAARGLLLELIEKCERIGYYDQLSNFYHNLGYVRNILMEDGLPDLRKALEFFRVHNQNSQDGHNIYNSLGRRLYSMGKYPEALEIFSEYYHWTDEQQFTRVPRAIVGKLAVAIRMEKSALVHRLEKELLSRYDGYSIAQQQEFCFSLSDAYLHFDPEKAIKYAKKGLQIPLPIYQARLKAMLGWAYFNNDQLDSTLKYTQAYLRAAFDGFSSDEWSENPIALSASNHRQHRVLLVKAQALTKLGEINQDISLLEKGYSAVCTADTILQSYRINLSPHERTGWNVGATNVSSTGAYIAHLMYQNGNDPKWLGEIFAWSEKSRALAHLDKLSRERLWMQLDMPNEVIEKENRLNDQIDHISQLIKSSSNADSARQLRLEQITLRKELDHFKEDIRVQYPQYYRIRHQPDIITLDKLQHSLNPRESLLSYFTTDTLIYGLLVSRDTTIYQYFNPNKGNLDSTIQQAHDQLRLPSSSYFETANRIYEEIVEPLIGGTEQEKMVIVADRDLSKIPFDLIVEDNQIPPIYLLHKYSIAHYPSASLYFYRHFSHPDRGMLALAPAFTDTVRNRDSETFTALHQIPGAQEEVKTLQKLFEGTFIGGEGASETYFKEQSSNYSMIHLASHTLWDEGLDKMHGILLTPDDKNDGILERLELYGLDLEAQLVTLSACNTGMGEIVEVGGLSSLAHAFHYAGCENILMSMWEIPDATAAPIIVSFYRHLAAGLTMPSANKQAKLDFITSENPKFHHPYYWGSFVLMGHHEAVFKPATYSPWIWVILILILVTYGYRYLRTYRI